jgi:hypothetical protein
MLLVYLLLVMSIQLLAHLMMLASLILWDVCDIPGMSTIAGVSSFANNPAVPGIPVPCCLSLMIKIRLLLLATFRFLTVLLLASFC